MRMLLIVCLSAVLFNACNFSKNEQATDSTAMADTARVMTNDWVCIAGERAGIVTSTTSEQELITQLGENVSAHDTIFGSEGFFAIGTILYKGTPNEAHIIWKDTLNFKNPASVEVGWVEPSNAAKVQWHTNNGIKIGTTLLELEKLNEKPFRFYGFGWDYGGSVSDWNKGKLIDSDGKSYLSVILGYDYDNQTLAKTADKLLGDGEFVSSDINAQQLNPFVAKFSISFR